MNQAQRESWDHVQNELGPRQNEVYNLIYSTPGGMTAWELAARTGRLVHAVRPRLTAMAQRGLIHEAGVRFFEGTKRNETVWVASHLHPPKFEIAEDGQHFFI